MIESLIQGAQAGNTLAARELLNRLVGRSPEGVEPSSQELSTRKLELAERRLNLEEEQREDKLWDS